MTENVYGSHHGLILKLRDQRSKDQILPMMPCKKCALNFKKKKAKKLAIFKSLPLPFGCTISMNLETRVYSSILVITNKSARICLKIFGDSVIQSLKSGKQEKAASFPCRSRKNLRIYSWYSLSHLKHNHKRFCRILSLYVPEMRPLGTF